ncbi:MAG: helix-turn-helix transcriptional regulator [Treponema sp.]|jgi:transcriptional regulator with XRE-family HTH domain|nr:helix-turn-helix transcriptional regulator [Treponema sp.]
MENIREVLARNLKEKRQAFGITQSELAERADISTNFIALIETRKKFPAPETLERLANALDIEISELFANPVSPETALRNLHHAILDDLDRAIGEALDKAIGRRCKEGTGKG